jgi:hypothetical protein
VPNQHLVGRIVALSVLSVPEFGRRASFRLDRPGQAPLPCAAAGVVAREFLAKHREGDTVVVSGGDEPRPATAPSGTLWTGRFRVHAVTDVIADASPVLDTEPPACVAQAA